MTPGKQLEILSSSGEIAQDSIIKAIVAFELKVSEMRKAQKHYFSSRNQNDLRLSKKLESEVDLYLEKISSPTLF